jgi:two-component system nitrate/nitrite response regulator NarL
MAVVPVEWDHPRVSRTVLIVDDHAGFRAMARAVLADGGFEVVGEAADAASALAAARELRPDCVLLDLQLGDADGLSVADELADEGAASAIVLTSGREPSEIQPLLSSSAARGFIAKERLSAAALLELLV